MKKVTKAVIPAAGLGTRFLPATKALPKEMLPIIDTPNIHYIVKEAVEAGITDILIIVSHAKEPIEDYFDVNYELETRLKETGKLKQAEEIREIANMANIFYVRQKEPKGLGDAIGYACWIFVLNIFPLHILILCRNGRDYLHYLRGRALPGLSGGACGLASYGIAIWAMTQAPIALVAALRETSVIFGMLLAIVFLGERFSPLRALAVVLVACGGMVLRLA